MGLARAFSLAASGGVALLLSACGAIIGLDGFDKVECDGNDCVANPTPGPSGDEGGATSIEGGARQDGSSTARPCPVRFCADFDQSEDPVDQWTSRILSGAQLTLVTNAAASAPRALQVVGQTKDNSIATLVKTYATAQGVSQATLAVKIDFSTYSAVGSRAPVLAVTSTNGVSPGGDGTGVVVVAEHDGRRVHLRLVEVNVQGNDLEQRGDDNDMQFDSTNESRFRDISIVVEPRGNRLHADLHVDGKVEAGIDVQRAFDMKNLAAYVGIWGASNLIAGNLQFRMDDVRFDFSEKGLF